MVKWAYDWSYAVPRNGNGIVGGGTSLWFAALVWVYSTKYVWRWSACDPCVCGLCRLDCDTYGGQVEKIWIRDRCVGSGFEAWKSRRVCFSGREGQWSFKKRRRRKNEHKLCHLDGAWRCNIPAS